MFYSPKEVVADRRERVWPKIANFGLTERSVFHSN